MLVPSQYGLKFAGTSFSTSAAYLFGDQGSGFNPGGVQAAFWGYLAGLVSSPNSVSNLPPAAAKKYSNVTNPARLTATGPDSRVIAYDGRWGKSRWSFSVFFSWQPFGPPSNQPLPT